MAPAPGGMPAKCQRNMMRMAKWSALLALLPALSFGANAAQQAADPSPQIQRVLPVAAPGTPVPSFAAASPAGSPKVVTQQPGTPPAGMANDDSYVIGAEDQLAVTVWADPRLSGPFLVRSDGRISMNL